MDEGCQNEADEDDEQEPGEREVRGAPAAPASLPAENEKRRVHDPGESRQTHDRVERGAVLLEAREPDPAPTVSAGRATAIVRPVS